MTAETLPDRIEVTIQEEDRQKADRYSDNHDCLIGTALQRMGYPREAIWVYPYGLSLLGMGYTSENHGELCHQRLKSAIGTPGWNGLKPYYTDGIVGKTITLVKTPGKSYAL